MQKINNRPYLICLYLSLALLSIKLGLDLLLLAGDIEHFPKFFPIAEVGVPMLLVLIITYKKISRKKYLFLFLFLLTIMGPSLLMTRDIIQYYFVLKKEAHFVLKEINNPNKCTLHNYKNDTMKAVLLISTVSYSPKNGIFYYAIELSGNEERVAVKTWSNAKNNVCEIEIQSG